MSFPFIVVNPDPFEIVSLTEAREWLNMDIEGVTFADDKIKQLVQQVIAYVKTETNISLGVSTYEWYPECHPTNIPDIFYIKSIVSITHRKNGVDVVIDSAEYSLVRTGKRRVKIVWASEFERGSSPYKVVFTAGLAPDEIPKELKMAIQVLVSQLYNSEGDTVAEKKTFSEKLINLHQIGYA